MRPDLSAMDTLPPSPGSTVAFEKTALDILIATLRQRGYTVVGPTVRDDAIVYDEIGGVTDLPIGYVDEQEAGTYRLRRWEKDTFFAYTVGPYAWKKFLYPPEERLWEVRRENGTLRFTEAPLPTEQYAFIGVRGCELAAIRIQDRIFTGGPYVDPRYQARRERLFILAVNCTRAGNTCFCASVGSGPQAEGPYDIALTELDEVFIAHVGSVLGGQILAEVPHRPATEEERAAAAERVQATARTMRRALDTTDLRDLLFNHQEHPHWEDVATRCLACTNCTLVCPTCFCFSVEDLTDLQGESAWRVRRWDSCFSQAFTYTAGRPARQSIASRYRQWLTHKLAGWVDQFGVLGCVGCGRCITWCPAQIDITEEVARLREQPPQTERSPS